MSVFEKVESRASFGGVQGVWSHRSRALDCAMKVAVYLPPQAERGKVPVLYWLSGLSCTEQNFITKAGAQAHAAQHGIALVVTDTSPRGEGVPDDPAGAYDFGLGAGFYVDAARPPFADHYRMWSYVVDELPGLIAANFPADMDRQSIMGHSMGGHGALTIALASPGRYKAVSAFSPIASASQAPWGRKALAGYLGDDRAVWRKHDAVALIEDGARVGAILVDQGDADQFLTDQLKPQLLASACRDAGVDLTLRLQPGYDHSYYFISTFMGDHLRWHADRLV